MCPQNIALPKTRFIQTVTGKNCHIFQFKILSSNLAVQCQARYYCFTMRLSSTEIAYLTFSFWFTNLGSYFRGKNRVQLITRVTSSQQTDFMNLNKITERLSQQLFLLKKRDSLVPFNWHLRAGTEPFHHLFHHCWLLQVSLTTSHHAFAYLSPDICLSSKKCPEVQVHPQKCIYF